jgi:hypothetical protein
MQTQGRVSERESFFGLLIHVLGTTSEHLREKIGFPITLSDG